MSSIKKQKYVKLDPIEHILKRPDMYIGSTKSKKSDQYVAIKNQDKYNIIKESINYSPGIERIFIEAISNACDNVVRSKGTKTPCTTIKININQETGETSVWNDGLVVPIEIHEEENIYNHTLIFSNLHAGENFDDDEERLVSGKNGLGIKTVNVFSSHFCVKGLDPKNKKTFAQEWKNNMKETTGPKVDNTKLLKGYTEVCWIPDFKQFGITKYTDDIIKLYTKLVIDIAMLTKVNVYLNDEKISINTLTAYAQLYENSSDEFLFIKTKDCDVFLTSSTNDFQAISFVNGIYTANNGVHVDAWCEALLRPLVEKFNGKKNKPTINIRDVKQFFRIFVCATVDKPVFDSQSKSKLESPEPVPEIKRTHITAICKWSSFSNIENIIKSKEMAVLKKSEKKKKNVKIEGYDPANNAGTKFSNDCTLILCEGLSAKTYAICGVEKGVYNKKGRDWFGVYPLRGKVLNVRNSSVAVIAKNTVITDLIQILGLKHGVDYTEDKNFNTLNYGRVLLLTDADVDGIHIEGLLMNFFHTLFPSVIERQESFLVAMKTPIIRIIGTKNIPDKLFYDERKFNEYLSKQTKKVNAKYYKGLGTTKPSDVPDTFGLKMVEYINDENTIENMNKVFHKKHADDRKGWLGEYNPENCNFSLDDQGDLCDMNISDFINGELIKFSHADCKRSIPNCMDGLKESQRKILYAVRKRKLKYSSQSLKVAQLGGYTAEHSNYHHGEQNLYDTIVKMANEFVGSNNIPLLYRDGMFGCVDPETPILLWNGNIKLAKDITVNDKLIGDDGKIRNIIEIVSGEDDMYDIIQTNGMTYRVNSHHILTIIYTDHKKLIWKESKQTWFVSYFDDKNKNCIEKSFSVNTYKSKLAAENEAKKFLDTINENNIFDINVQQYLKISKTKQNSLKGFFIQKHIEWHEQELDIDPYILGMWLGDGDKNGRGFSSADYELVQEWVIWGKKNGVEIIHTKNDLEHENYHYTLRRKGVGKYIPVGHPEHNSENCIGCSSKKNHSACDWHYENWKIENIECKGISSDGSKRNDYQSFIQLLKKNNLYNNKHIPNKYIFNSKENRLKLLAGFIDTDGCLKTHDNSCLFEISQDVKTHGHLIDSLEFIAKSIGFRTSISYTKNRKDLRIWGENIYEIPTKLSRKQAFKYKVRYNYNSIKIEHVDVGKFVGWTIDGNERFLLGDFTVTHNTRAELGKDAASARYIFTKMDMLTEYIFREEDESLLELKNDDGDLVEPYFYIPILPMVLVNGITAGIGTGWSCNVPSYNPLDIIECIKIWLENDGIVYMEEEDGNMFCAIPDILPWYRGFKGTIEESNDNRYITYGICEEGTKNTVLVTEIPVNMSITKFKEHCEDLLAEKQIKDMKNYSTPNKPHFVLTQTNGVELDIKTLKLHSYLYTSNMVLFDEKEQIHKFETVQEIIDSFCKVRYEYYIKRKKYMIEQLEIELQYLGNKERFITEVVNQKLDIMNVPEDNIIKELKTRGYDENPKKQDEENAGYDYLLRMQVRTFTANKIKELKNDILSNQQKLDNIKATSEKEMWINELEEFAKKYNEWLEIIENEGKEKKKVVAKGKKK
jgi:DNA gyrase/topoisomerase IV subunit B